MPNISLGNYPRIQRFSSGFFGMDLAMSNLEQKEKGWGIPATLYIVYGNPSIGKSTLCWTLASARNKKGNINIMDLEIQDPDRILHITDLAGYEGNITFASEDTDEKTIDLAYENIKKEETTALIVDSVGAISPISEREGEAGSANMGRRAKLMSEFSRKIIYAMRFRKEPPVVFLITHVHDSLSAFAGKSTAGGKTKDYMSLVNIYLTQKEKFEDKGVVVKGLTEKNRTGLRYQDFYLVYIPQLGFHRGLTAVYDCILQELATRSRTISMDGVSYGYMSKLIDSALAGDNDVFIPFIEALEKRKEELCS